MHRLLLCARFTWFLATVTCTAQLAGCATGATGQAGSASGDPTVQEQAPTQTSWRALVRDDHSPPPKPWVDMERDERKAYMRDVVVPTMEPLFLAFDGERYANFGCKTCHGMEARATDYDMPCADLFTLHPTGTPEQRRVVAEKEETARFMFNAVTPTMRQLLGAPHFDRTTGEGFSCFTCHPKGDSDAAPMVTGHSRAMPQERF